MKNIISVLILVYLAFSDVILKSDTSYLTFRPSAVATAPPDYAKIDQAPEAVWIWDTDPIAVNPTLIKTPLVALVPNGMKFFYFFKQFNADCLVKMTIYAASNTRFCIVMDSEVVINGTQPILYSATFMPKYGINSLAMVIMWNEGPIGFIYAIVQDTSACYNCPDGQRWNPNNGTCECRKNCCTGNQTFRGLPYCDCICKCPLKKQCDKKHYWDENSCSCECLPTLCRRGQVQNPKTCNCECVRKKCGFSKSWNQDICDCNNPFVQTILSGSLSN